LAKKQNDGSKSPAKKVLTALLRTALVIVPLAWIYSRANPAALWEIAASINVWLLVSVFAILIVCMALQGIKWWILICRFVPELKLSRAVSVHFESMFYAIVLPSGVAQDVVKSVILSKTHSPSAVWAASWLGRLIGLLSMLFFSIFGIMRLESDIMPAGFRASLFAAVAAIVMLTALSFSKKFTRPIRAAAAKITPPKIMSKIEKLREGIYVFKNERSVLAQTFVISFIIQFLSLFNASLVVYIVSGKFYLIECLAFVPIVEIMAVTLPLTPGGIGIREALMTLLFMRLSFTGDQIALYVTISLLASTLTRITGAGPVLYRMIGGKKHPGH
jgi:uncharacterized protein (TIRG00374 family)